MTAKIQLAIGIDEEASDVKITRSKDGDTSVAVFFFESPNCMSGADAGNNEILGMYMIDEEGQMVTRNVNAKFINGKSAGIEAIHKLNGQSEWERFLRFMNRYAEANGMSLNKA
ncbi:MAG: photosystem II reaction center protein Psb28 [Pseudanabaena sp.]|jgi:photosystem II protein|uniref:photosystem II reaction center protein Psb28 n=1 Tax=Pseudanabaena mucicola TaxID=71190 RepID=UPI000E96897D|nr:photosystem II reaction center protein Psb28 [Pseudanabaena mucicola]MCA6507732.1 photosystem II reaction center protein Psb28 [Pseudanabaena sp. M172S2SP2A07QC]MCA6527964.1 photosystem II reaction center protein Psb28 [Pseudanabaena sp. M179S2SP2A07QC]MCA6571888.1 photosystem II reaction center protein Psb28 [Pseudanabaena sp. M53BS1SP1A06MG]MCA6584589.1 photosystem II reaction center protein Psb28 [Pseudanabaena sp. M34BS1SP1A06MG]MCA6585451.1 photosystem II reaction center protein Psb28 